MKNQRGQIFIFEIFLILVVVLIIVFLEIMTINNLQQKIEANHKNTKILEELFIVETFVSDCNYFANKKQNICYRNNVSFNKDIDYKKYNISKIKITEKEIYNQKNSVRCYKRAVVYNNKFNLLEMCFYD